MAQRRSPYKTASRELTIADAVSEAFSEIQSLRDEMREWAENLESGNLGSTQKYQDVNDAADTLDRVADDEPEVPEALQQLPVVFQEQVPARRGRPPSRSVRCGNASSLLSKIVDVLDEHEEGVNAELDELRDKLSEVRDEIDGVEFPGMYG